MDKQKDLRSQVSRSKITFSKMEENILAITHLYDTMTSD